MPRDRITLVICISVVALTLLALWLGFNVHEAADSRSPKGSIVYSRRVPGAGGEVEVRLTRDGRALTYRDGALVREAPAEPHD